MSSFGTMQQDPRYVLADARGWQPGAGSLYDQEHSIDPETGAVLGPLGHPPWMSNPLMWQTAHEQGVEMARSRLGRAGTDYLKGAAGNLQTFRPGGHAALTSGIYSQLAQGMFQRASMLRPVDLLASWRAKQDEDARRRARRANRTAQIASGVGAIAALGLAPATGGASLLALPGLMASTVSPGAGGGMQMGRMPQQGQQPTEAGGFVDSQQGFQQVPGGQQQGAGQQSQAWTPEQGAAYSQGMGEAMPKIQGAGGQPRYPGPQAPQGGGPQGGMQRQGQQRPGGPAGEEGGAGGMDGGMQMGMGAAGFGSNGDFSPLAMASMTAGDPGPNPQMRAVAMNAIMLELLEGDPDFAAIDEAIGQAIALRAGAA